MPEHEFKGQFVLVTGGARGIGLTIAQSFARRQARTVIADIDAESGRRSAAVLTESGYDCSLLPVNLSQSGAPQRMIKDVVKQHGRIDILVNNARSGSRVTALAEDESSWHETMSVTLQAAFFASQEAIRHMMREQGGLIINIGSILTSFISTESPSYHAAKAGLLQITRYFAVFGGKHNIRVNIVSPGFIVQEEHTERFYGADNAAYRNRAEDAHALPRIGTAQDVAAAVVFLASGAADFI